MSLAQPEDGRSHDAWFSERALFVRLRAALRRQRGGDDRLVRVHVGDGRDADARRLDDGDGVMRMPGQRWPVAAASFLGMWIVMMVAMILPSMVPMLWRYRQAVDRTGETRLGRLTALVGVGHMRQKLLLQTVKIAGLIGNRFSDIADVCPEVVP
jgi:predicted metal-binding membrane protein